MPAKVEFDAVIERDGDSQIAFCAIPFSVESVFNKKRVKIKASLDAVIYRGLLTPMSGRYLLGINKQVRADLGKTFGDTIRVRIEEDEEPREVVVPLDFQTALAAANTHLQFSKLSFSHQKEYVTWIECAKKTSTRNTRIEKAILMLAKNKQ